MFRWEKLGKLFDPKDLTVPSWMHDYAQSPSVVELESCLRVFFCSRPAPDAQGLYLSYIGFIDLDKTSLQRINICQKPVLTLGKFGTFDEFGTYPVSVIRDGTQLRAYYAGWTRCESVPFNAAIGVAISDDMGENFRRIAQGPVLSYSPDEPFLLGSPRVKRVGDQWLLFYVAGKTWLAGDKPEPVYKIRMASSTDGLHWTKAGLDLIPDKLGATECQACPDVHFHNGRYHMFFSYRDIKNYRSREGGYRIGYAVSDDLRFWQRQDELIDLPCSDSGWDSEMVNYPHVFSHQGSFYMLYQGNEMGRMGFGLARLAEGCEW